MPSRTNHQLNPYRYGWGGAHIAYNPIGTKKSGNSKNDEMAVVDVELRYVYGLGGVRILDAGVFVDMIIVNSMLIVVIIGKR